MTDIKVGDRVKVTIEGPVWHVDKLDRFVDIGSGPAYYSAPLRAGRFEAESGVTVSVEVAPPPEPEWQAGDVLVHRDDTVLVHNMRGTGWSSNIGARFSEQDISVWWAAGEVTHALRDGKPVTP